MEKLNFSPLGGNNEIKVEKDPCGITATSLFQNEIQPPLSNMFCLLSAIQDSFTSLSLNLSLLAPQ